MSKTPAELGVGVIGRCGRCGGVVDTDPLALADPDFWVHQDGRTDHHPVLGRVLTDAERAATLARTNGAAGGLVEDEASEDETAGWTWDTPHPEPEVAARPAEPDEIPRGAKTLLNFAKKNGWTVEPLYARGTTIEPSGRPYRLYDEEPLFNEGGPVLTPGGKQKMKRIYTGEYKVVEVLTLRMRAPGRRAVASWKDGSFEFALVVPNPYQEPLTSTQLKAFLADGTLP